jgi:hypothetical protein
MTFSQVSDVVVGSTFGPAEPEVYESSGGGASPATRCRARGVEASKAVVETVTKSMRDSVEFQPPPTSRTHRDDF